MKYPASSALLLSGALGNVFATGSTYRMRFCSSRIVLQDTCHALEDAVLRRDVQ